MRALLINFPLCEQCSKCEALCSYPYHRGNRGIESLREKIASELYCRKCRERACARVCPRQAIEVNEGLGVRRSLFRCISCYNCALACPFGVLYLGYLVYRSHLCDLCPEREPECIRTCPKGALTLIEDSAVSDQAYQLCSGIFVLGSGWHQEEKK